MTTYEVLSLVIGSAQCGLIYYGLHVMRRATEARGKDMDQRHEETMTALEQQMTALEQQTTALTALIARG